MYAVFDRSATYHTVPFVEYYENSLVPDDALVEGDCHLAEHPHWYRRYKSPKVVEYDDVAKPFNDHAKHVPFQLFDDRIEFDPSPHVPYKSRSKDPLATMSTDQRLNEFLSQR